MQIDKERAWREDEDRRRLDRALVNKYEGELDKSGGMRRKQILLCSSPFQGFLQDVHEVWLLWS